MKKILMTLAAVLCCTMTLMVQTSCSIDNYDNAVMPGGQDVITINTASLYEKLGITEEMTNNLATGKYTLTDTILIYDQTGKLVSKIGAETSKLEPLTFKATDLSDGSYTLVAWQSAYNNKGVRVWYAAGEEQLSTVGIGTPYGFIDCGWAVGYASVSVTVKDGIVGASVTPDPMVSIVDVRVDNYPQDAEMQSLQFYSYLENVVNGFYLDPSRSDADRWHIDTSTHWESFASVKSGKSGGKFISLSNGISKTVTLYGKTPDGKLQKMTVSDPYVTQIGGNALCYFDYGRQWKGVYYGSSDSLSTWFATPFGDQIREIKNISNVTEIDPLYNYGFKEHYLVEFEQPIDHKNPTAGTFKQRALLCYAGSDRPTVLHTCGYKLWDDYIKYPNNHLAQYMDANLIMVEYRYFGESTVTSDPRWDYLTLEQAAGDHHNIVQALKPLLPKEWVSTGTSKDGETALVFRYYYPDDVTLTVPFCAPFMTSLYDPSMGRYLMDECGTQEERTQMKTLMRRMLQGGEQGIYTKFVKRMQETRPNDDRSFTKYVFFCFEFFQGYFQYGIPAQRKLPSLESTDDELLNQMLGNFMSGDYHENNPDYYPYLIQIAKEMGRYAHAYGDFADLLAGTSFNEEQAHRYLSPLKAEDQWLLDTYDNTVIKDILERFVPTTTCPILFVYAKDDPCTGACVKTINEQHSKIIINPDGYHSDYIGKRVEYSEETCDKILDFVSRYVKY